MGVSSKNIVLISSGQPSLNPRLVKEADALVNAGHKVTVLYAFWNEWGTKFDQEFIASKKWDAICLGGDPRQKKITYFFSRLIHKVAKAVNQKTRGKYFSELAITRAAYYLMRDAKKHKADLYIAHNLGALPAAAQAAKANNKPCGFDAEDFHRFEISDVKTNPDVILKTKLEDRYIPQISYLTVSSPMIGEAYERLFLGKNTTVILNAFPANPGVQKHVINSNGPVRLFWFSQTIGTNRGIEDVLDALALLTDQPFELHLLGYLPAEAKHIFNNRERINIHFHEPVTPDEIIHFAAQFDIGLATEGKTPLNRDICLTNKIFTYLQAGLTIIASNTSAQQKLLNDHPGIGKIYEKGNSKALAKIFLNYHQNRDQLLEAQKVALALGSQELNWEKEQCKFLALVDKTINKN